MASTSISPEDPLTKALVRVAELEGALKASQTVAQSANKELQHFVYAASHDLQEPLRAIVAYSQLLERMYADDEQARELTSFIISGVGRMHGLLNKLVTYSQLNPAPTRTNVNLNAAVQSALFKLAAAIKESGAEVRYSELPIISAHEIQMAQLFEQVLSNSIVYRRNKPEIDIVAEEGDLDGDPAQLVTISDNGVGVEQQFLKQVLQPFKRLHGKDYPGNGLGLAICEKIMKAHQGKIWLESDGQHGTSVHLAFPY